MSLPSQSVDEQEAPTRMPKHGVGAISPRQVDGSGELHHQQIVVLAYAPRAQSFLVGLTGSGRWRRKTNMCIRK